MEIWKNIEGYEGRYEVSNEGRVRSLYDNRGRVREEPKILIPLVIGHKPNNVYHAVNLYKNKKCKQHSVHRLVAIAFLPNPNNLPLINHKDEDTFNNCKDNLEWCTNQYNQEYSLSKKIYRFLSPEGVIVEIKNLRKFSRENDLNHAHMYQVAKGNLKTHKGWSFVLYWDGATGLFNEL